MQKGLDSTFVQYGIRADDLRLIETLALEHGLDFEWVQQELLRAFHEARNRTHDLGEADVEKLIEKALTKLR